MCIRDRFGGDHFGDTVNRSFDALGVQQGVRGTPTQMGFSGRAEGGYSRLVGPLTVTLFTGVQSSGLTTRGYSETTIAGPSLFDESFAPQYTHSLTTDLGLKLNGEGIPTPLGNLTPYGQAAWRHEFSPLRVVTPTFQEFAGATPFTVLGASMPNNMALLNAGMSVDLGHGAMVFTDLNGSVGGNFHSASGQVGVRFSW